MANDVKKSIKFNENHEQHENHEKSWHPKTKIIIKKKNADGTSIQEN